MILTKKEIENIAEETLKNFSEVTGFYESYTAIDQLARDYLHLEVKFAKLSDNTTLYGLTAYEDTKMTVFVDNTEQIIEIKQNQIVLDSRFIEAGKVGERCAKRRFTLAHEIAHQLLYALESNEMKKQFKNAYSKRVAHTFRELKTFEDWNEWQANYLGAALLMPKSTIEYVIANTIENSRKIISYEGALNRKDRLIVEFFCTLFGVSKSAILIRLKNLGYLEERTFYEYCHPLEVVYE